MNPYRQNDIHSLVNEVLRQRESLVLEQLNELVKRGLLVVTEAEPVLVRDSFSPDLSIRLSQFIKLELKEQEYISKLEKENQDLKNRLEQISKALGEGK